MKKNTIAIIGLGYWGTIVTKTVVSMNIFSKIYINDIDKKKVNLLKKKFQNKVFYLDLNKIKKKNSIKHIFLATPPKINFNLIKSLIKYDKNILVEKPGLINLKHYKIIKKLLIKSKSKLTFGYIYIYNKYIRYLKKIINSKELGSIKYINFQRQNFGPIRNKVSATYDLATHDISILYFLFNKKIILKNIINHNILGKKNYDISYLNLKTADIKIDINVSWLNPEKIRKIIVIGSKKMLLLDELNHDKPMKIYNNYVNFPKIHNFSENIFNQSKYIFKGKSKYIKLQDQKPLDLEIKEFIRNKTNITNLKFSENIIRVIKKK